MPYYCTVPRCTSMAGKAKNVSFHQFPRDEELALLWNKILKRGKPYTKYSKVCSLHFRPEDYTITSVGKNKGQWRTLRKDAIPSRNLPSESPIPSPRRNSGSWVQAPVVDARVQQHMAQAIYMQTMMAMQAANGPSLPTNSNMECHDPTIPHTSRLPLPELEQLMKNNSENPQEYNKNQEFLNQDMKSSYKCDECSKCFKDPDVFTLHRRSHKKTNTPERLTENISNLLEKENFNANSHLTKEETLKANPILANLLKSGITNPNDLNNANMFDTNNILSIENHIMTQLASNMESYIRNLTSLLNSEGKGDKDAVEETKDELPSQNDDENGDGSDEIGDGSDETKHSVDAFNAEGHANSKKFDAAEETTVNEDFKVNEDRNVKQEIVSETKNSNLDKLSREQHDKINENHEFVQKEGRNKDNCDSLYQDDANKASKRRNIGKQNVSSQNNKSHNDFNEFKVKDRIKKDNDSQNEDSNDVENHETVSTLHIVFERESDTDDLNDSKDSNNLVIDECA